MNSSPAPTDGGLITLAGRNVPSFVILILALLMAGCATSNETAAPGRGTVALRFVVNEEGETENIQVLSSTNPAFEAPAIAAIQKWKFKPGRKDGKPAKIVVEQLLEFNPTDGTDVARPESKK